MTDLSIKSNPKVRELIEQYPEIVQEKLFFLRDLIIETARESVDLYILEETLKWREPSYLTKHGSTIRMDWKSKNPDHYAIYFQCTSRLVETFRTVFGDLFEYEDNRAIVFKINDNLSVGALKQCFKAALNYHKVKKLETLGI